MIRLICILIGYVFGLFQTGYIYGKLNGIDIRSKGSGNAGTTNALRVLGMKAGAVTFLGDAFKCIFAILFVKILFGNMYGEILPALKMYTALGTVLGHNYPFYLEFKGGKGIAVTAGLIISTVSLPMTLICVAVFASIVLITRYVSLGSLVVVLVYLAELIVYGQAGNFGVSASTLYEIYFVGILLVISAFIRHKANIVRLLSGNENKISLGKK